MCAVISDTGPLNYLILIEATWILPRLFTSVLIPAAVNEELSHGNAPSAVREWVTQPPSWLPVAGVRSTTDPGISSLHEGEREVITLGLERPKSLILMDDRRGAIEARRRGLQIIGTLAVLDTAAEAGLIDLPQMLVRLRSTSFRSPTWLMARMLEQDALRRK